MNSEAPLLSLGLFLTLLASAPLAHAACSGTVAFTGGQGAAVVSDNPTGARSNVAANRYPTAINVTSCPGQTVVGVTVKLNSYSGQTGFTGNGNSKHGSSEMGLLLASPSGRNLEIMHSIGYTTSQQSIPVLTIQDGQALMPAAAISTPWNQTTSASYAPTSNTNPFPPNATSGDYTINGGPTVAHAGEGHDTSNNLIHTAAPNTLAGVFAGETANGNWQLYLVDNGAGANVSFASWEVDLTFSTATTTTTVLTPSPSIAFTASPSNSVTLTALVSGSNPTGTVTFTDNTTGTQLCSVTLPVNTCTASFTTQGVHALSAAYNGDGANLGSSGSANVFVEQHSINTGTTYCNSGTITNSGNSQSTVTGPYPSVINVGSPDTTTNITTSVSTVSVQLNGFSANPSTALQMLLVAPDNNHSLEFFSEAGSSASSGNYTFTDAAARVPGSGALSPGSYGPGSYGLSDLFTPNAPAPAPQAPLTYSKAAPVGSQTFLSAFTGAEASGAWKLFVWNDSGSPVTLTNGWCVAITPGTGSPVTVTVNASPAQTTTGTSIAFTATVLSSGNPVNVGTVSFSENGVPLAGTPNGGVANVVNGTASISTAALGEGDHVVTATYSDSSNTFNPNVGTVTARVDNPTSVPTVSGATVIYCNPGKVTIPYGTVSANDIGPASPNPSNLFVTGLYGTINTVQLQFKSFHDKDTQVLASLLVGPGGTSANTLDFFSEAGLTTPFASADINFADNGTALSQSQAPTTNNAPGSFTNFFAHSYTASPFFTLPGSFRYAKPAGAASFTNTYGNTNGNGTWSLYFQQNIHDTGNGLDNGWCAAFTENQPVVGAAKSHTGNFVQGQQGAAFTVTVTNNGPGPTGDPDNNHPLTVTDTLPSVFTPGTLPGGAPWNCISSGQVITCQSHNAVPNGGVYPALSIPVNVSNTAGTSATNQISVTGGGTAGSATASDLVTIDPAPDVTVTAGHTGTFTQGGTGTVTITGHNIAPGSTTYGTTTVTDTLPAGWTVASVSGGSGSWACGAVGANTITCTSQQKVMGGGNFTELDLTVNIPATSAVNVTNNVAISGGGELSTTTGNDTSADNIAVVQVAASISLGTGVSGQSATTGTAFSVPLSATVFDAGHVAIGSAPVTFTAPAQTGASGTFSNSTGTISVTANASGVATAGTFTANANAGGPYNVSVTSGSISANIALNNIQATVQITVATSISGPTISVDSGAAFTGSKTFTWSVGASHTLATTSPQSFAAGSQYAFTSWSDGGALSHSVTAPSTAASYTANFQTQYQLTTVASPAAGGTISPATEYVTAGSTVSVNATAGAGYVFGGFSGGLTGTTTPQNVVVTSPVSVTATFTPGATSLGGSIGVKSGPASARLWPLIIGNNGPGVALNAQVTSFTLQQTGGAACTPVVQTAFPVTAGNLAPQATAPANVSIDFTGCAANAIFRVTAALSANGGAAAGSIVKSSQLQ